MGVTEANRQLSSAQSGAYRADTHTGTCWQAAKHSFIQSVSIHGAPATWPVLFQGIQQGSKTKSLGSWSYTQSCAEKEMR